MSNIVEYGGYSEDAAAAEQEELNRSSGGGFMRLEEGRNVVRFLPPPVGRNTPFLTIYQHFIDLPGRTSPLVFNCPRMMLRENCPACAKADQLKASSNKRDQEGARDFWANRRIFASVIDRNDEDSGPKILGMGRMIHEALIKIRKDPEGGDFTDPTENGFDIVIERQGQGLKTRYTVMAARRSSALGNLDWIAQQPDLQTLAKVPTWEEIVSMVRGEDQETQTEEAAPPARQLRGNSGGRGHTAQSDVVDQTGAPVADDDLPF